MLMEQTQTQAQAQAQEPRREQALECDHEFETVDRLDKDTVLQVCLVCDFERMVEK